MSKAQLLKEEAWRIRNSRDEAVRMQAQRVRDLLKERSYLNSQLRQLVLYSSATKLIDMLNNHTVNSTDILLLFAERAFTIGLDLCLITQENFDDALRIAQNCDRHREESGLKNWTFDTPEDSQYLPCMYGIPISLKDTIYLKGMSSTAGTTIRHRIIESEDGLYASVLRKGGLIPFVKSNLAQLVMTYESTNHLFGRARNPWNQKRTTGGSSGGEGGLIASRCSVVGIGSDVGGSIRIPSQFCGVYGLKTSSHRLSFKGHTTLALSCNAQLDIPFVIGPLGSSPNDLALIMKVSTELSSYEDNPQRDPYTKIFPFDVQLYKNISQSRTFKIGYFETLDFIETTPASRRAVNEVVNVLRQIGHEVVAIQIPNEKEIIGQFVNVVGAGGMKSYQEVLQGQPLIDQYSSAKKMSSLPAKLVSCIAWVLSKLKPRMGFLTERSNKKSAYDYLKASYMQKEYQKEWIKYWKDNELQLVVAPGFGSQAQLHGLSQFCMLSAAYTFIWNVLEMTAGSMPVTVVRKEEQNYRSRHEDSITERLTESAKGTVGLPVGVQIIGLPYAEEKVLGLMKAIDDRIQFSRLHRLAL